MDNLGAGVIIAALLGGFGFIAVTRTDESLAISMS
jgi:hypothetical protein